MFSTCLYASPSLLLYKIDVVIIHQKLNKHVHTCTYRYIDGHTMFGIPQQESSEEEKKLRQEAANSTLKTAAILGTALWLSPIVWNFVKKQWH